MKELYDGLEHWRNTPFDWQTANCCHFAKDMLERRGVSVPIEIPELSGAEEARVWLRENGHASLYLMLTKLFGRPVGPLQARRGDIVYTDQEAGAVGVVDRAGWFLSDSGLISIPLKKCRWAFHVHE